VREKAVKSASAREPIVIGLRLNNYELVSILGEGGMGAVYLARHTFTGRKAAVKLLHPQLAQDQVLVTRFMNEARATAAIGHPNIIDIIDVGFLPDGRAPYLMMELLQGESLAKRLQRDHPLPIPEAIEIAVQTAFALTAAHAAEIVHRDLKPDNLFLVPDPSMGRLRMRVKVLDFGIAKLRGELSSGSIKTQTGTIMGTPQYMSPEQCRGLADQIDHRTDIYALGIIVYEMVCGSPPFVSEGLGDMLMMHMSQAPAPPRTVNPAVPESLEATILHALAKDPNQRFACMADFQEALRPGGRVSTGSTAVSSAPARAPDQVPVQKTVAPASDPSTASWVEAPVTTLTSTMGQVAGGDANPTWRRVPRARRAVLAGGVLVAAALVVVATVALKGRPTTSAASIAPAPAPVAAPILPAVAPVVPLPDAAPLPAAAHATVVASAQSQPVDQKTTRPEKTGAKKNAKKDAKKGTTVVQSTPSPLPPPMPTRPQQPPPPQAPKKVERW
jgi:serine/threonine-protein kinase